MVKEYYVEAQLTTPREGLNFDYAITYDTYAEAKEAYDFEVAHPFHDCEKEAYHWYKQRHLAVWECSLSVSDSEDDNGDVESLETCAISYELYHQIDMLGINDYHKPSLSHVFAECDDETTIAALRVDYDKQLINLHDITKTQLIANFKTFTYDAYTFEIDGDEYTYSAQEVKEYLDSL